MAEQTRTGGREATSATIPGKHALSIGKPPLPEPPGFTWRLLADLARLESGHTPSRSRPEYWDGGIPWIGIRDATANHGRVITSTEQQVSSLGVENSSTRVLPAGTVCLSRTASVGYVVTMGVPMATSQDFVNWVCGPALESRYLHYLLMSEQESIRRFAYGSVHPTMYYPDAKALWVCVPSVDEQRAIAEVLGALDDKIAANTRLVALGSELLDAELDRSLAGNSRLVELGDVAEFHNRRRIPLSSREREGRLGSIPYYGASGVFGWVDEALFDDRLVLVGEDGSVITEDRHPVTQYIWGPSWVNNHAHVLSGRGLTTEMLYLAVRRADVSTLVTGAVQPKISMGNLKRLEIRLPGATEAAVLQSRVDAWFGTHRALTAENLVLTSTRDALLPALMSGALRVRDAEHLAADLT